MNALLDTLHRYSAKTWLSALTAALVAGNSVLHLVPDEALANVVTVAGVVWLYFARSPLSPPPKE